MKVHATYDQVSMKFKNKQINDSWMSISVYLQKS